MKYKYFLNFKNEFIELFHLSKSVASVEDLINEVMLAKHSKALQLAVLQLKFLFDKFDSIHHRSCTWHDNLKTLLTHGFSIASADRLSLTHELSPIQFELRVDNIPDSIHFGFFYKESQQSTGDTFIKFCRATEYPPGIHQHIITQALLNAGGSLIAIESGLNSTLIRCDLKANVIAGEDSMIQFVLTSSRL